MGGPSRWFMAGFGFSTFSLALLVDQVTKALILTQIMNPPRLIELWPMFNLTLVRNSGTAFGLFAAQSPLGVGALIAMTGLLSFGVLLWMLRASSKPEAGALGLILGGALGNLTDRLRHGAVTDFLDLHYGDYHWPSFNFADVAITLGTAFLLFLSFRPVQTYAASSRLEISEEAESNRSNAKH